MTKYLPRLKRRVYRSPNIPPPIYLSQRIPLMPAWLLMPPCICPSQYFMNSSKMGGLTKKPKREIRKLIFLFRRALNESGVKHGDPHRSNMLVYLPNTSAHHISIWITQSSKYLRRKSLMVTTMRSPIGSPA